MSGTELVCDLCKKEIPLGAGYVSINYHIENMNKNPITRNLEVEVISAEDIFTMCGKCGNRRNATAVKQVLKTALSAKSPMLN